MSGSGNSSKTPWQRLLGEFFHAEKQAPDSWNLKEDRIFRTMILGIVILGALALTVSTLLVIQEKRWGMVALNTLLFCWIALLHLRRKSASREMTVAHLLVLTYLIGCAVMFMAGPLRSGLLYLFAFQFVASSFFGGRAAKLAMALNLLALAAVALAASQGLLSWIVPPEKRLFMWVSVSANFIFLSGLASFVIVNRNREILNALEGEKAASASFRNETREREAAVLALRDSEKQYRQLVENISEAAFSLDAQGDFAYLSPRIAFLTGFDPADYLRKSFFTLVHPLDHDPIADCLQKAQAGEKGSFTFRVLTKSHAPCWASAALTPAGPGGEAPEIFGLLTDVTAQKAAQMEKEALEARLAQAQKMEAVGRLAGGIAHDFNNMLSPILGYSEMLLQDFAHHPRASRNLSEIVLAAKRARDLVRQILIFGSKAEDHPRPMDLSALVRDAVRLVRASLPASIAISVLIEPSRFVVNADPVQLQRVLLNICSNASHAMQGMDGLLEVIMERDRLTQGKDMSGKDIAPGPYARLTIRDNGHGMSPETLDKIFEPYFTTKEVGEGSGIGLAVAHSIIANLGGSIQVTSQPGKWTCFCILLPLLDAPPQEEQSASNSPLPRGTGRILLADDEPALVNMTREMLARLGYDATIAANGLEAIEVLESSQEPFDLLITDLAMPGLSGDKLAKHVREYYPDLPIILCTGHSESIPKEKAAQMGLSAVLPKPVDMRRMALTVYRLINPK